MRANMTRITIIALLFICLGNTATSQIKADTLIQISMKGVPDSEKEKVNAMYPVSKEGTITLPYLGKIIAAGKTSQQLEKDIEKAYADAEIYPNPTISVLSGYTVKHFQTPLIHLGGCIVKPGPVNFSKDMTLSEAIKAAGGFITESSDPLTLAAKKFKVGDLKQVKLFRDGKVTIYDMTKVENHSVQLKKNDVIVVMAKSVE